MTTINPSDIPKLLIIGLSLIIITSYIFSLIARKTGFPSVLLLLGLGIGLKYVLKYLEIDDFDLTPVLEVLGIIGLIMIVLEAALELKIDKDKVPLIVKSFLVALLGMLINTFFIAFILSRENIGFKTALIYATPLAVMSSAIVLPSVKYLKEEYTKEFMIYESTFSDIIGIIFFYSLLTFIKAESNIDVSLILTGNILLTILIAIVLSYLIIYLLQRLNTAYKLFFIISILILFYSLGKILHLSSLIIILIFGLILSNKDIFIKGFIKRFIQKDKIDSVFNSFHLLTIESAFVIRTLFFVAFGISLTFANLFSMKIFAVGVLAILIIYASRFLLLKSFLSVSIYPKFFIAPRGLISILLFFSIPEEFMVNDFETGILLLIIIITNICMAIALIFQRRQKKFNQDNSQKDFQPKATNIPLIIENENDIEN